MLIRVTPIKMAKPVTFLGDIYCVCVAYMYVKCMHTCHSIHVVTEQFVKISLLLLHGFLGLN